MMGARRGIGRPRGRRSALSSVSFADLQREMQRREALVGQLVNRRELLAQELEAVDREIFNSSGGAGVGGGRGGRRGRPVTMRRGGKRDGRSRGGMSLVAALSQVLSGKTMSVKDMASAVKGAGYKSSSPNLRTMINQALIKRKDAFRKEARG